MPIIRNPDPGQIALDAALKRVEDNAPADWKFRAERAVRRLAAEGEPFTTDDVWKLVGTPPEPRALGAVMVAVRRSGGIVPTGEFRRSNRPECHKRDVKVWVGTAAMKAAA